MPPSDLCLWGELGGQGRREGCILRAEGRGILLCAPQEFPNTRLLAPRPWHSNLPLQPPKTETTRRNRL